MGDDDRMSIGLYEVPPDSPRKTPTKVPPDGSQGFMNLRHAYFYLYIGLCVECKVVVFGCSDC